MWSNPSLQRTASPPLNSNVMSLRSVTAIALAVIVATEASSGTAAGDLLREVEGQYQGGSLNLAENPDVTHLESWSLSITRHGPTTAHIKAETAVLLYRRDLRACAVSGKAKLQGNTLVLVKPDPPYGEVQDRVSLHIATKQIEGTYEPIGDSNFCAHPASLDLVVPRENKGKR